MKVLIINDSNFEKMVLETNIKELGLDSKSGDEYSAMDMIKDGRPDIIFVNLHMKETNGDQLIRQLKKVHYSGKYVLTSSSHEKLLEKQRLSEVTEILKTPFSKKELKELIDRLQPLNG